MSAKFRTLMDVAFGNKKKTSNHKSSRFYRKFHNFVEQIGRMNKDAGYIDLVKSTKSFATRFCECVNLAATAYDLL